MNIIDIKIIIKVKVKISYNASSNLKDKSKNNINWYLPTTQNIKRLKIHLLLYLLASLPGMTQSWAHTHTETHAICCR